MCDVDVGRDLVGAPRTSPDSPPIHSPAHPQTNPPTEGLGYYDDGEEHAYEQEEDEAARARNAVRLSFVLRLASLPTQ